MSDLEPRLRRWRRRLRRWAIRVALGLSVLLIVREIVVTVLWRRYGAEQDRVRARLELRDGRRTPLVGPGVPGNAWDDYAAAAALVEPRMFAEYYALECAFSPRQHAGDDVKAMASLREGQAALLLVESGTRRETCRIPLDALSLEGRWRRGNFPLIHVARLLGARARLQLGRGDVEGALSSAATQLQLAIDVSHGPSLMSLSYGAGILTEAGETIRYIVLFPGLGDEQARRLEAHLAAAEARVPNIYADLEAYSRDRWLSMTESAEEHEFPRGTFRGANWWPDRSSWVPRWMHLWKFGFSPRLALLDHQRVWLQAEADAAPLEALPWSAAGPGLRRLEQTSGVRLVLAEIFRTELAWLRLLRAALQLRRDGGPGAPDWPDDPFTRKPLRLREMDGARVIWSEGTDGDQGGVGDWRNFDHTEDIILVVEKNR